MHDITSQQADHGVSKRAAIKAGGLAGAGLAFSKPLISGVRPKTAFGDSGYAASDCIQATEPSTVTFTNLQGPGPNFTQFDVVVQNQGAGFSNITLVDVVNLNAPNVSLGECDSGPVTLTFGVESPGSSASVTVVATDCCNNESGGSGAL